MARKQLKKRQKLTPDLIVMDLSMPRMNGLEAAREIKRKMPDVYRIILFTQHKGALQDSDARSAGINVIVSKSDKVELLVAQILNLLAAPSQKLLRRRVSGSRQSAMPAPCGSQMIKT